MSTPEVAPQKQALLPRLFPINSKGYYIFLGVIAVLFLGPLGGVSAAYSNFALGTFVGGQVLAGILGSVVTYFYGPDGKHGANYMQTMAASVASMGAMGVLIQAMVWLGMPLPETWKLILYFLCIGMFGVGVGMLYTPILVDKLQLTYPSGLAVANILRALTDVKLLKKSVGTLVSGIFGGAFLAKAVEVLGAVANPSTLVAWLAGFSPTTFGGGMIVGARVTASAIFIGGIGVLMSPWLVENGYINAGDPFRKIGFIFALGTILGAAIVDLTLLARDAIKRVKDVQAQGTHALPTDGRTTNVPRLIVWVIFWAICMTIVANQLLNVPLHWMAFAVVAALIFQMINGISQGMTDQNPISSAFVVSVLTMSLLGLRDPLIGLMVGSVLLISCTVGVDMQQDRSTGWRLGSDRNIQFRYQMLGVVSGAVLAVVLTRLFLTAYPVLNENLFKHPELREGAAKGWQSAMTYKFAGVLDTLSKDKSKTLSVMGIGVLFGIAINLIRKYALKSSVYLEWKAKNATNQAIDFVIDGVVLASPYASSFGGFVDFPTSVWWGLGGMFASTFNWYKAKTQVTNEGEDALPEDMSTMSLFGGGMIAGESLFITFLAISGLIASGTFMKLFGG
jgi:uncharacterized oligopeptide transporter (OPT) family protein